MRLRIVPGRTAIVSLATSAAAVLVMLLAGVAVTLASFVALALFVLLCALAVMDYSSSLHAWRRAKPTMTRQMPPALAIGVKKLVQVRIDLQNAPDTQRARTWRCELHDHADATLVTHGLPTTLMLVEGKRIETSYAVTPTQRGEVTFAPADVRVRSRWGFCE